MKRVFIVMFVLMCISAFAEKKVGASPVVLRSAKEFTARGGLPNFYRKLSEGKPVKIAYFGGSITCQEGWRMQSLDYFRKLYPKAEVNEIHAAIGGTGSKLGAFRLESHVIRHKPDLVFVEYAVNDSITAPAVLRRAMEGIVRQVWKKLPETDICFVYTFAKGDYPTLKNGKMQRSASIMEEIADHYRIPTIHMGLEAVKLAKEGKLILQADPKGVTIVSGNGLNRNVAIPPSGKIPFSPDGVHPYLNTGHVLYTNALKRALPEIAKAGKSGSHLPLPEPIMKDNYELAKMIPLDAQGIKLSGPAAKQGKNEIPGRFFRKRMPENWKLDPGAQIEFKFKGTAAYLYCLVGPGSGMTEITVDGKVSKVYLFDGFSTYFRLSNRPIVESAEDTVHTVRIKVLDEPFDKRAMLSRSNRADFDKYPKKYADRNCYIGSVMIVGEIVK